MSLHTTTLHTITSVCDRCNTEARETGTDLSHLKSKVLVGWARVTVDTWTGNQHEDKIKNERRGTGCLVELCPACYKALMDFYQGIS